MDSTHYCPPIGEPGKRGAACGRLASLFLSERKKSPGSVEEEVREKIGAGLVRVWGEIRNPFGCKDFLVDKEVPRAGTAVAHEDCVGRVGHDLGLAAVFQGERR